jgi:hypothetical protein
MPIRDIIQVLHDLIVYMTADPDFYTRDITGANVVKDWCRKNGAIQ